MGMVGKKGVAMYNEFRGNCIRIAITANEFSNKRVPIQVKG